MNGYLRTFRTRETAGQFLKTGMVGVINTVVSFALFNAMRVVGLSVFWSVTVAFGIATLLSYVLNRRWSFRLNEGGESVEETVKFFAINIVAWAVTQLFMWLADVWLGPLGRLEENLALLGASLIILGPKFATYRDVVFRSALDDAQTDEEPVTSGG